MRLDRVQIQVVLLHLIRNAIEAMSCQGCEQRFLGIETFSTADTVGARIVDSGPAIDPAILPRMFEAHFTTKPQGLGLGLSVCHSFIKTHGGRLWAQPNATPGLTVEFTLPFSNE